MATLVEVAKHGSALHVDAAVQKLAGQLNKPSNSEVYPLHVAVWRNHLTIIERLLEAGAWTHCTDGESGWRVLGAVRAGGGESCSGVGGLCLGAGASVEATDLQGRTPVDLVSSELRRMPSEGAGRCSAIYSWGSGANYQLGTGEKGGVAEVLTVVGESAGGSTDFHLNPLRVEALQGLGVVAVVAAKFHSAALTADGRLLTWGWGRGGRLGHPDYNIHSGESALIHPWQVAGLGRRVVVAMAAGKHHMLVATSAGDVWSWGGNRDGKLGYPNVDTQPTPRKIDFKGRAVLVAASNRHSACLTSAGEVWTWGANNDGQLGYGTNNSANNPTPRVVEAMKGKVLVGLSLSKRHTVVVSAEGDVFTWGHRVVTPRRVQLAGCRDTARLAAVQLQQLQQAGGGGPGPPVAASAAAPAAPLPLPALPAAAAAAAAAAPCGGGGLEVRFHRNHNEVVRPEAALAAAGYSHTTVVTRSGEVLCWRSADPALRPQEVAGPLAGKCVVAAAAGKTRTVVVTDTGQVYMWECKEPQHQQQRATPGGGGAAGAGAGGGFGSAGAGAKGTEAAAAPGTGGSGTGAASGAAAAAVAAAGGGGGGSGAGAVTGQSGAGMGTGEEAQIVPVRVTGLTRVTQVAVGEKHTLALQAWSVPPIPDEHGVMPGMQRHRRQRRSGASGSGGDGSSSSGSDDEVCGGGGGGRWWRSGGNSFRAGGAAAAAAVPVGSLTRGGSGLGSSVGTGFTPPPGSSPMARSFGTSLDLVPSPLAADRAAAAAVAAAGGNLTGFFAVGPRRRGDAAAALAAIDEPGPPGWELFSHRTGGEPGAGAPSSPLAGARRRSAGGGGGFPYDGDDMFGFNDGDSVPGARRTRGGGGGGGGGGGSVPSLQVLCQRLVATQLVEPRTALPILEYADVAGAALLRCYCLAVAVANLDCTLLEAPGGLISLPSHLLAELEHLYRAVLLAPAPTSHPQGSLPALGSGGGGGSAEDILGTSPPIINTALLQMGRRPTAAPAWLEGASATDRMTPQASSRLGAAALAALAVVGHGAAPHGCAERSAPPRSGNGGANLAAGAASDSGGGGGEAVSEVQRLARNLQRKLQQISSLEELQRGGRQLDAQQHAKLSQRGALQEALMALAAGAAVESVKQAMAHSAEVASKLAARPDAVQAATASASGSGGDGRAGGGWARSSGGNASGAGTAPLSSQPGQQQPGGSSGGPGRKRSTKEAGGGGGGDGSSEPLTVTPTAVAAATATTASVTDSTVNSTTFSPATTAAGASRVTTTTTISSSSSLGNAPTTPATAVMTAVVSGTGPARKQQQRRGALSVFLSGALDQPLSPPPAASPPPPVAAAAAPKAPAWGGAKLPATPPGGSSLRDLLSQQPTSSAATVGPLQQQPQQQQTAAAASSQAAPSRSSAGLGLAATPATTGASASSFPIATAAGAAPGGRKPTSSPFTTAVPKAAASSPAIASPGPAAAAVKASPIAASAGGGGGGGGGGGVKLTLAEFMSGRPITAPLQVASLRGRDQEGEKEPAGPAWGGVQGGSPVGAKSLLDIQAEQALVQKRAAASWARQGVPGGPGGGLGPGGASATPNAVPGGPAAIGAVAAVPAGTSPPVGRSLLVGLTQAGAPPLQQQQPSKWYVPEQCQPAVAAKPLTAIQTEERAIKEITARYGGRVVARVVPYNAVEAPTPSASSLAASAGTGAGCGVAGETASGRLSMPAASGHAGSALAAAARSKQKAAKGNTS
ncbi:hypothetical protein VOLCADRAFT_102981 [Volvox carteri f. nagariensis]|uniref:RCC1-like domain-containing protein n=1 Tax=Volvox carteri f. nagariensis TaxID=3068 RepID=D8TJ66_VOLCA|nr:uncharacterized protein VOLCADRAFT_102981 [Volvox carteri f. nagariensis]EFJ52323.1 hypothetical protein VOLCADRAFT_102981 [Volvox carteri f. nagariensis]|eukprot:XP_002946396.1 hypothetical protein VOLCADRAFT_102981 [Volvox carteri f. nagariensis]